VWYCFFTAIGVVAVQNIFSRLLEKSDGIEAILIESNQAFLGHLDNL
jgi:hypothetical protein